MVFGIILVVQSSDEAVHSKSKPVNMKLEDDTLLEEINFTENVDDQADLALLDQCIILASWYVSLLFFSAIRTVCCCDLLT